MFSPYGRTVIIKTLCEPHTLNKAFKIAFVVGTILNIINQWDALFRMNFEKVNYYKLVLTYFVPFFVSTYTAININMRLKIGEPSILDTNLTCNKCKSSLHVKEKELIPSCPKCAEKGQWKAVLKE